MTLFKPQDKVLYCLRRGLTTDWIPATVQSSGPKRVVIIDDLFHLKRLVKPENLRLV